MNGITLHNKRFVPYLSEETLQERIITLAKTISTDYSNRRPLFIAVLNGSFIFAADLFRRLDMEAEISFIKLVSYNGTLSTGNVVTAIGLDSQLQGRHIILLEDIIDTGKTLHSFLPRLWEQSPASLEIATLLSKPDALRFPVQAKYTGFSIPDKFVVGYGLDYDGLGRNLPALYQLAD